MDCFVGQYSMKLHYITFDIILQSMRKIPALLMLRETTQEQEQ